MDELRLVLGNAKPDVLKHVALFARTALANCSRPRAAKSCKNYTRGFSTACETKLGKVLHWSRICGIGFRKVRNNGGPCSFLNSMFDVEI